MQKHPPKHPDFVSPDRKAKSTAVAQLVNSKSLSAQATCLLCPNFAGILFMALVRVSFHGSPVFASSPRRGCLR
jgi:hypothetical protein